MEEVRICKLQFLLALQGSSSQSKHRRRGISSLVFRGQPYPYQSQRVGAGGWETKTWFLSKPTKCCKYNLEEEIGGEETVSMSEGIDGEVDVWSLTAESARSWCHSVCRVGVVFSEKRQPSRSEGSKVQPCISRAYVDKLSSCYAR